MADIKKGTVYPKQQLELIEILKEKPYGQSGKSLLPIMAKNLSLPEGDPLFGKSTKYTIFDKPELKAIISPLKAGDRFIADIEERERPETQYGPDRTIVQIYVNGQPVSVKKGGGYGKSPEQLRQELENNLALEAVKRRSIEGQTSMAQVGEIIAQGINPCGGDLDEKRWRLILGKYWQAVEKGLDNFLASPIKTPTPVKTTADEDFEKLGREGKAQKPSTEPKPAVTVSPVAKKELASAGQEKPQGEALREMTLGRVLTWCASHGKEYNRTWFFQHIPFNEAQLSDPVKLRLAIQQIQTEKSWTDEIK